jgi:uncharacterized linocin/CFP29 family protein
MLAVDYIYNGQGFGSVADRLLATNFQLGALRPFTGPDGRSYMTLNHQGKDVTVLVGNTPSTLMYDEWKLFDTEVIRVARPLLNAWGAISGAGLTRTIPNGLAHPVSQQQSMTDFGNATISMDGLREARRDRPVFDTSLFPLPIIHADFSFSLREILVSRNTGVGLDTTAIEQNTRKIVEEVERLTLGTSSSYSYGGGTVYGLTNFPERLTKVLTLPTAPGWEPAVTYDEILDMIQSLQDIYFNGPYGVFVSPGWTKYMNTDYSAAYPGTSLASKLREIGDIRFVRKVDYLSNFQIVLFQLDPNVIQNITGLPMTTMQWESHGGMQVNFKIMTIMVPRVRKNANEQTGIIHGTAA